MSIYRSQGCRVWNAGSPTVITRLQLDEQPKDRICFETQLADERVARHDRVDSKRRIGGGTFHELAAMDVETETLRALS